MPHFFKIRANARARRAKREPAQRRIWGRIANGTRFALEVAAAVANEIRAARTGIRLSPRAGLGGTDEGPDSAALYRYLVSKLAEVNLAYIHLAHHGGDMLLKDIRTICSNTLLVNRVNQPIEAISDDIEAGHAVIQTIHGSMHRSGKRIL